MKTDKKSIIAMMSILLVVKILRVKAVKRNISQYPVCINDEVVKLKVPETLKKDF